MQYCCFSPAGDHVKFGFPLAWTTSTLAWGLVEFRDAYSSTGQLDIMLDSIKWPLDYFIKCHVSDTQFYGQVRALTILMYLNK